MFQHGLCGAQINLPGASSQPVFLLGIYKCWIIFKRKQKLYFKVDDKNKQDNIIK